MGKPVRKLEKYIPRENEPQESESLIFFNVLRLAASVSDFSAKSVLAIPKESAIATAAALPLDPKWNQWNLDTLHIRRFPKLGYPKSSRNHPF